VPAASGAEGAWGTGGGTVRARARHPELRAKAAASTTAAARVELIDLILDPGF